MSKLTVQQSIDNAKKILRDNGFFVDILWSFDDVWNERFDCSEKLAQEILFRVFSKESIADEVAIEIDNVINEIKSDR